MINQTFDTEDAAADFIANIKLNQPEDDLIYVIVKHSPGDERFKIKLFLRPTDETWDASDD
jgi:hypothetical protein